MIKYILKLSALVVLVLLFINGCSQRDVSYIGKNRDDIIKESIKWKDQVVPKKITIGTKISYYHFEAPNSIYDNKYLMHSDVWRIDYHIKKGFFNKLCSYEIKFENNIVISQKKICSSDAI